MLELTKDQLGGRDVARANSQAGETIMNIPLSKVIVREGFNVRQDFGDIEGLGKSILENGQVSPARVDVLIDGTFMLVDGNRRYLALKWIEKQYGDEPKLKAIINVKTTTEEERILQMFTSQDNKPLESHEVAELIKRLINLGFKQNEIAGKIGKTAGYVSQMLSYANEGQQVKTLVKEGKVSVNTVLSLQKTIPSQKERSEAISAAVDNSKTGKKITIEEVAGKAVKPIELFKNALNDMIITGKLNDCDDRHNETVISIIEMVERFKL